MILLNRDQVENVALIGFLCGMFFEGLGFVLLNPWPAVGLGIAAMAASAVLSLFEWLGTIDRQKRFALTAIAVVTSIITSALTVLVIQFLRGGI